jgi:WD40 repeat protein
MEHTKTWRCPWRALVPGIALVALIPVLYFAGWSESLCGPQLSEITCTVLEGHTSWVHGVDFSPDGRLLASAAGQIVSGGECKLWELATGTERTPVIEIGSAVNVLAFSPNGQTIATASADQKLRLWDAQTGQECASLLPTQPGRILTIVWSRNGRTLTVIAKILGTMFERVTEWDVATNQERILIEECYTAAISRDCQRLALIREGGVVELWDVATGGTRIHHKDSPRIHAMVFSPDGQTLAISSIGCPVKLWDIDSGRERTTIKGHEEFISSMAFSADGRILATASYDRTIKLWDAADGKELATLSGHAAAVHHIAFSPDGQALASGGFDKIVRIWDLKPLNRTLQH